MCKWQNYQQILPKGDSTHISILNLLDFYQSIQHTLDVVIYCDNSSLCNALQTIYNNGIWENHLA